MHVSNRPESQQGQERIWILEKDLILRQYFTERLSQRWPQSACFETVYDLEQTLKQTSPDLLIMDFVLKYGQALEACAAWRARFPLLPIIVMSARQCLPDRLAALSAGADLFLAKPLDYAELEAYVESLLARSKRFQNQSRSEQRNQTGRKRRRGELWLDPSAQDVFLHQQPVGLTPTEFGLLWALSQSPGEIYSREALAAEVWPNETNRQRSVDQYVKRLRQKLTSGSICRVTIETAHRKGYWLQVAASK